jgi:hypothetical protein
LKDHESAVYCKLCETVRAFTHCLGCGMPVCENCARAVEKESDQEDVWSLYFCPGCVCDPDLNPDATLPEHHKRMI